MKNKIIAGLALCAILTGLSPELSGQAGTDSMRIWVDGLCGMCKATIEKAALKSPGVETADWDADTKTLSIAFRPERFKEDRLHYRIAASGYDTKKMLAPDPVYEALPMCCKYRDFKNHDEALGGEGENQVVRVSGHISEIDGKGKRLPLQGAHIHFLGSGSGSTSDENGHFEISGTTGENTLVVSYVGMGADTIEVSDLDHVEVDFSGTIALDEVSITHRIAASKLDFNSAYHIRNINEKELSKAACCNLSESFETNPSVDASFTDAITGTKKIEMLGLAGPYVQIMRENMPDIRGLLSLYGLNYTPGTWIESMQLNMGSGSVVNGFESFTGQINVELHKPMDADALYLNAYGNSDGAMEANIQSAYALSENLYASTQVHGNFRPKAMDMNDDGFMDHPTGGKLVAMQRFQYKGEGGFSSQLGIKGIYADQHGGQTDHDHSLAPEDQSTWGSASLNKGIEAFMKAGRVFEGRPYASLGFQASFLAYEQDARFGLRNYLAEQRSIYANLIYQGIIGNTNHQFRSGLSFQGDFINEKVEAMAYDRRELVPGAFLEYTFNHMDRFSAVLGIRADYHNNFGAFLSPRLHLRYEPIEQLVFRASAGRGLKTASIFAENIGLLASSRNWYIESTNADNPYGLMPEIGWNYGLNLARGFQIRERDAVLSLDYFYTNFSQQVLVDLDQDPSEVHIYMLDGSSHSHSLQAQLDLEPIRGLETRLAYRLNDVRSDYRDLRATRPLTSRHRAFINLAYTRNSWAYDFTWNWIGSKRIPDTSTNPEPYRLASSSPAYSLLNLQLTRSFEFGLEVYGGIENILGFRQDNAIIAAEDPYSDYFDASLIWGPVFGRKFYLGLRYRL